MARKKRGGRSWWCSGYKYPPRNFLSTPPPPLTSINPITMTRGLIATTTSTVLLLLLLSSCAHAFNFSSPPAQCANVTLTWGAGGSAPYEILLVPVGHITPETRTIINYQNITTTSGSFSFPLTFPAGSQFVAVLSDSKYGPGSGGTSDILTVQPSTDDSCLGTKQVKPEFYFYLDPPTPSQCSPWEIGWPQAIGALSPTKDDAISLWAIVPGEATFAVPLPNNNHPNPTDASLECSEWTVDLKEGTQLMLVAGYEPGSKAPTSKRPIVNGRGKGGSTDVLTVGPAGSFSAGCLASDPPATSLFPSGTASLGPNGSSPTSSLPSGTSSPLGATNSQPGAAGRSAAVSASSVAFGLLGAFGVLFFGTA